MTDRGARQKRPATSRHRQSWSGWSEGEVAEKDRIGVFLDGVTYAFAVGIFPRIADGFYGLVIDRPPRRANRSKP